MSIDARRIEEVLGEGTDELAAAAAARLIERAEAEGLVDVAYATFDSPLGTGHIAATERGIVSVGLPNLAADRFLAAARERRLAAGARAAAPPRRGAPRARRVLRGPAARVRARARLGVGALAVSEPRPARDGARPLRGHLDLRRGRGAGRQPAGLPRRGHGARPEPDPDRRPVPPRPAVRRPARRLRRRAGDEGVSAFGSRERSSRQLDTNWQPNLCCQPCQSTPTPPHATLTKRQQEVLDRLEQGMGAQEIARDIGVSRNAVYQHIERLRRQGALAETYTPSGQPPRALEWGSAAWRCRGRAPRESALARLRELAARRRHRARVRGADRRGDRRPATRSGSRTSSAGSTPAGETGLPATS